MGAQLPEVSFEILEQYETGLTTAVVHGVKRCHYNLVLVMDADGQHDPYYIPIMLSQLKTKPFDIIIGSKWQDQNPLSRRVISRILSVLTNLLLHHQIQDIMSGFIMARRELFYALRPSLNYKFLLQLLDTDPRILELPIQFHRRKAGTSKASVLTALHLFLEICRIKWKEILKM